MSEALNVNNIGQPLFEKMFSKARKGSAISASGCQGLKLHLPHLDTFNAQAQDMRKRAT